MKCTLGSLLFYANTVLATAGFCERWPKACAMGLRWLRPAAFDYGKKLAANGHGAYFSWPTLTDELN